MKKYIITLVLFLSVFYSACSQEAKQPDWLFIYYMPYDNNLSGYGEEIINMLESGVSTDNVVVVVQADFADQNGFKRYTIRKNKTEIENVNYEKSGDTKAYSDYLSWVSSMFAAKKHCFVFLDHGGKLNELCQDTYPENKYLKIENINGEIESFNKRAGRKAELIYMQVCAKGSVEPVFEIRNCANYTMFSQNVMGAPNYYYKNTLQYIAKNPNATGKELAVAIKNNEKNNMYYSLICVNNGKLNNLPSYFNNFIKSLSKKKNHKIYELDIHQINYASENYWDIVSFLNQLNVKDANAVALRQKLINLIENEIVVFNKINPYDNTMKGYCGLSLFSPTNANYKSKYNHLDFFKKTQVKELMNKIKLN